MGKMYFRQNGKNYSPVIILVKLQRKAGRFVSCLFFYLKKGGTMANRTLTSFIVEHQTDGFAI
jgi:hypothetical protein